MNDADAAEGARRTMLALVWRVGLVVREVMLRTGRGPLRPFWSLAHEVFIRAVAARLRRDCDAAVYVGGSFGCDEPVFGLSDIDLIVVARADDERPGLPRAWAKECWRELCRRFPPLSWVISEVFVYEEEELRAAAGAPCLTYGLDDHSPERAASFFGPHQLADEAFLLVRPGLWPTRQWRLVSGPDLRPPPVPATGYTRLAAWLELQFWWRYAFDASIEPMGRQLAFLCVKLVAEPARILLWLVNGEQVFERRAVLERAIEAFPEEAPDLSRALELNSQLHHSPPAPLGESLRCLVRFSSRLAEAIAADVAGYGKTEVALTGGEVPETAPDRKRPGLPLADWRARTMPRPEEELFVPADGDPSDLEQLAAAVRAYEPGVYPVLHAERLLVLPARAPRRNVRAIQCAESDPVSFALADGRRVASFPDVPGWSAVDCARRAVAEHRGWLDSHRAGLAFDDESPVTRDLGMLLSASRAACFLESVEAGAPELALTFAAAAERISSREPAGAAIAEEAYAEYRDATSGGRAPSPQTLRAMFELVARLPAYSGSI